MATGGARMAQRDILLAMAILSSVYNITLVTELYNDSRLIRTATAVERIIFSISSRCRWTLESTITVLCTRIAYDASMRAA